MRPTRPIGALIGLLAIGGVAGGCGATTHSPPATVRPPGPVAARPDPPQVVFLAPSEDSSVHSTVIARVKESGHGRLRFILDGRPRIASGSSITYRHLAPGQHRLVAQLLASGAQRPAATATTRFEVRRAPAPTPIAGPVSAPSFSPPAPAQAPPAPSPPPAAPPASSPPAAPPAPSPSPAPSKHVGGGIPQGGGGDGDGDNSGGPSDGDGNV